MPEKFSPDSAGVWLDGSLGWHNSYRVVDIAEAYGFELTTEEEYARLLYRSDDPELRMVLPNGDVLTYEDASGYFMDPDCLVDRATAFLQDMAPDGYYFAWDMGELSLVPESEMEV
jgi:hypothetical protein